MKSASLSWRRTNSKTFTNTNFKGSSWGYIFALKYPSIQLSYLFFTFEKNNQFQTWFGSEYFMNLIIEFPEKTTFNSAHKLLQVLCIYFLINLYIIYCIHIMSTSSVNQPYEAFFTLPSLIWPYYQEVSLINAVYPSHPQFHLRWWHLNKCT